MGSLFSGVGLLSGLNTQAIVDQLMSIEGRPRDLLQARARGIDAQKAAYLDISARITAILSRITSISAERTFRTTSATSSLPDVLSATVDAGAPIGTYSFAVRSLASTQQAISRGFADNNAALSAGVLTLESALARVNRATRLDELNGGKGVQRGRIELTDRSGKTATVSIAEAQTVNDAATAINSAGIGIRAEVRNNRLELTDTTNGSGSIRIRDLDGGHAATDLGFGEGNNSSQTDRLSSAELVSLTEATSLAVLNDRLGLRRALAGGDFQIKSGDATAFAVDLGDILKTETRLERLNHGAGVQRGVIKLTARNGVTKEIDLASAKTIGDVKTALEGAFGTGRVSVVLNGSRLIVTDTAEGTLSPFKIEDVSGTAARDLGIAGSSDANKIDGRSILSVESVRDVLAAIQYAGGNVDANGAALVKAEIDPARGGLVLRNVSGSGPLELSAVEKSKSRALEDLGFKFGTYESGTTAGGRLLAGANSVLLKSLNGGRGFELGTVRIESTGGGIDVDLSGAESLSDVVTAVNSAAGAAGMALAADLDATGTRLVIGRTDNNRDGIRIQDVSGNFAAGTGLAGEGTSRVGGNLQRRYVNENTLLSELANGQGIGLGTFKITNRNGLPITIDVRGAKTVQDVLDKVNETNAGVEARINDTGDGIQLVDSTGGSAALTVTDVNGTTARDLNLLGSATDGRIDGTFELRVEVANGESLQSVLDRVSGKTRLANANILNDGSGGTPLRLNLSSRVSGAAGELIIDGGATGLDFTTLTNARDASVLLGDAATGGILITSNSNTIRNVAGGLTLNLSGISDKPVAVTVTRSNDDLLATIRGLVSDFNGALDRISDASRYNKDTEDAGPLLGDSSLRSVEDRLYRALSRSGGSAGGAFGRASQLGIQVSGGGKISFNEERFIKALESNPSDVLRFFTAKDTGFGPQLKAEIDKITGTDGLLQRRSESLSNQQTDLNRRVEQLSALLETKRTRLMRQFQAMESALSQLQAQQAALGSLTSLTQSAK